MLLSKKIRKDLIKSKDMKNYLKYAFGEILLVVIGILIALYIKGLYAENLQNEQIDKVGTQIIDDLRSDTAFVNRLDQYYAPKEKYYLQVIGDSLTAEDHKDCAICGTLVTSFQPIAQNTDGYAMLKNFEVDLKTSRDSLIHTTRLFYTQTIPMLTILSDLVQDDITDNLKDWRDTKPWYSNLINGVADERYFDYVANDPMYKNRVANIYLLLYKNVLSGLKEYARQAAELAEQWEAEIEKNK